LVTGFLATEWNEFGSYFTVRQRDAHAWVEVYFPHSGWVTMDPTPAIESMSSLSMWETLVRIGESFRLQWDRVVIRYSAQDQLAVVRSLRESSDSARDAVSQWFRALGAAVVQVMQKWIARAQAGSAVIFWLPVLALGGGLAYFMFMIRDRWYYRRSNSRPAARKHQQIVHLYRKMLEIAARRGIQIKPSTTPKEFADLVSRHWIEAEPTALKLTSLYCQGRFSGSSLSSEELNLAVDQISALQRLMRATP
jgi:hypothetical protein